MILHPLYVDTDLMQEIFSLTFTLYPFSGFSKELTRLFRNGFPPRWKELIESSFGNAEE